MCTSIHSAIQAYSVTLPYTTLQGHKAEKCSVLDESLGFGGFSARVPWSKKWSVSGDSVSKIKRHNQTSPQMGLGFRVQTKLPGRLDVRGC